METNHVSSVLNDVFQKLKSSGFGGEITVFGFVLTPLKTKVAELEMRPAITAYQYVEEKWNAIVKRLDGRGITADLETVFGIAEILGLVQASAKTLSESTWSIPHSTATLHAEEQWTAKTIQVPSTEATYGVLTNKGANRLISEMVAAYNGCQNRITLDKKA